MKVKLLPVPGKADTVTLKLAPIKMTDLGGDNKLDAAALSSKIMLAITDGIAEQGTGVLPKEITGPLASELKRAGALTGTLFEGSGEVLETGKDAGKEILEKGKDLEEKTTGLLKGLLKPKEKQEE